MGKVEGKELEQLSQEFKFNGNYALARQIDAQHVAHALNRHGDLKVETPRNQIPITLEDISNYPNIVKSADIREVERNNIIYKKQINGHYVVVEEALTKKNKISFVTMWKGKGDLTTLPTPSSKGYDLDRTLSESYKDSNPTTPTLKNQATELFNTAKEQEAGFKELLEGLKGPSSSLEATNTLKSLQSLQEKLAYYKGDTSKINDTLRGAVLTDKQAFDSQFMRVLENLENNPNTTNITPNFIETQDGYQGVHINFDFNGVTSELQIHTPKSWAVKKKLDPLYKAKRRLQLEGNLSRKEAKELRRKMKNLAQESDLDSNLFTSLKLTSPQESPHQSVVVKNSLSDLNATQEPPLNSKAGSSSASGNAYNRLDSKLNQKSTSLTGGKGIDIQTPLAQDSTQGLKDKPLLLTYKNTQELVTHAKAEGLSPARIGQLVQERKQAIAELLPFKREANINSVIFKEDIKNNAQIVLEGRQAYLSHAQLLQALGKAKELRSTSPSAHTLVQHKQSRLAQLQDRTLAYEWLKAFNLKSLDEPFIPQFSPAVQQVLEPILKGEQIQLTRGSLVKLEKRQREEFLPYIKPALEQSDMILRDKENALIFVKDIGKKYYFTSVARSKDGAWSIRTNSFKTLNRLKNIVGDLGEVLHVSEKAPNILAETFKVKAFSNQLADHSNTTGLKGQTQPNPAFGKNFKEFEGKGAQAVAKLLQEKHGQVAGAFYREDLGYIDLVWGVNAQDLQGLKGANGKPLKPYGLSKIAQKHLDDFSPFEGNTPLEKLGNGIESIINNGNLVNDQAGVKTFILKDNDKEFRVGISQGWEHEGKNYWIITAYENRKSPTQKFDQVVAKSGHGSDLAQKDLGKNTTPLLKPQEGLYDYSYDEFQGTGLQALMKILHEKAGEVRGAFSRGDLGYIDVVWGKKKGLKGDKIADIGLSKIAKSVDDLKELTNGQGSKDIIASNALTDLVRRGVFIPQKGFNTLCLKNGPNYHILSLFPRSERAGKKAWVMTDYIKTKIAPESLKGYQSLSDFSKEALQALGAQDEHTGLIFYMNSEVKKALGAAADEQLSFELSPHTLFKIEASNPEQFLPHIRPIFEDPNVIVKYPQGGSMFVKEFKDLATGQYWLNVADFNGLSWVFRQHSAQDLPAIQEKIKHATTLYNAGFSPKVSTANKHNNPPVKKPKDKTPLKNIEPNPAFGENFSEFAGKGKEAVAKLLKEKHGQVAGAFYREDLGHIDLVWGDSKKGLAHILERRTQQYGEQQALEFIHNLPRMLQEAKFYKELENKIELVTPTDMIVLGKRGDNKFVLTGFKDRRSKDRFKELENPQTRDDVGFTGKSVSEPQTKDDVLLPNQANSTKPPLKVQTRPWGDETSAEPEEIVKIVRQTFGPVAMQNLESSINYHKRLIKERKKELKRFSTDREQILEGTHPHYTLDPERNIIKAIKKREDKAKSSIESSQAKIQEAQNTLEAYRIWKEVKDDLTPLEELKINFYNTERLAREGATNARRNAVWIEKLAGEVSTEKYLAGVAQENLSIWPNIRGNFPTINERLKKLNSLVKKMHTLDKNSITPKMQASLQELEQKGAQQQEELAEMEKLFNAVVAKWEKIHNKKAPNAHFNPKKPKSRE
ncbi:putative barnase/colicin E5 family endoribonuclease [Helicobacter felis]|uniref:putative barnase/colicin E5 family endoribonuclease n=1 Tax=Helicobacter felis TaxID=214 RepID=UPI001F37E12D|nr:PBECR2 nuclease fold domain-containing protein [Helicobacter felis]